MIFIILFLTDKDPKVAMSMTSGSLFIVGNGTLHYRLLIMEANIPHFSNISNCYKAQTVSMFCLLITSFFQLFQSVS